MKKIIVLMFVIAVGVALAFFILNKKDTGILACDKINAQNIKLKQTPTGSGMVSGYIFNDNSLPIVLQAAVIQGAKKVELHKTEIKDSVAKMMPIESLTILPKQSLLLKSGGAHIMLMGFSSTKKTFEGSLLFSGECSVPISGSVKMVGV